MRHYCHYRTEQQVHVTVQAGQIDIQDRTYHRRHRAEQNRHHMTEGAAEDTGQDSTGKGNIKGQDMLKKTQNRSK